MARMHAPKRGKSQSIRPASKRSPSWCKYKPEEVEALVVKLAKEGNTPSRIGETLRDQYGIPLIKPITGKTVKRILAEAGVTPEIPEDLNELIGQADRLHAHLKKSQTDRLSRRVLQLTESKIRRLASYYRRIGMIPTDWKYRR